MEYTVVTLNKHDSKYVLKAMDHVVKEWKDAATESVLQVFEYDE